MLREENDNDVSTKIDVDGLSYTNHLKLKISRPVYTHSAFNHFAEFVNTPYTLKKWINTKLKPFSFMSFLEVILGLFPFTSILQDYQISHFLGDLMAGVTVGVIHIPQGMAFAMLANVPPVHGLYTSFFPSLLYFFFGTSKHISLGPYALVNLIVGTSINRVCMDGKGHLEVPTNTTNDTLINEQCKLETAVTLTFLSGVIQLVMAILNLGVLTEYLSTPLTRAFTTAASIHILTSQLAPAFGFRVENATGSFSIFEQYRRFFTEIWKTRVASLVIFTICSIVLFLIKHINHRVIKYIKIPVPIDFILILISTFLSHNFNFEKDLGVEVVGEIPKGFPEPMLPTLSLMFDLIPDAISIAVISFVTTFALTKHFADKDKYKIRSNQELFAISVCNSVPAFFQCIAASASLSRSSVQYQCGGKTQIAALVSCALLFLVLMFMAPFFYALPTSVLAAVIVVNLKGMFVQFKDLKSHFRVTSYDGLTWLVTFGTVVMVDVNLGLLCGLVFSFFTVILRTQIPPIQSLGVVPGTECYRDLENFKNTENIDKVKIYRPQTSLCYANHTHFQQTISRLINSPSKQTTTNNFRCFGRDKALDETSKIVKKNFEKIPSEELEVLLIDCSLISFIDSDGITTLERVVVDLKEEGVKVHLAGCSDLLHNFLKVAMQEGSLSQTCIYLTLHDAVLNILAARKERE